MTTGDESLHEREDLAARARSLNVVFETTSLPELLDPLITVDLTIQQMKVLTVLVTAPEGSSGRELSETFGVSMASMSGMLDRLAAQRMIERTGDPTDARVRRVRATDFGRSTMRRLIASRPEFDDDLLLSIPVEDLRALVRGMTAIQDEMRRRARERAGADQSPATTPFVMRKQA